MTSLLLISSFLAQETEYEAPKGPGPVFWICEIAFIILMVAAMWKVFSKAGQPGWAAIIPIVNMYFLCKVAGRPGWWVILLLIPLVNLIIFMGPGFTCFRFGRQLSNQKTLPTDVWLN